MMVITFQNKREDLAPVYDYLLKETPRGRGISRQAYDLNQGVTILLIIVFTAFVWGISANWRIALIAAIPIALFFEGALLLKSSFRPRYYFGRQTYLREEATLSAEDWEAFCLPKTIRVEDDWLEISCNEYVHRSRWRRVDPIAVIRDFILLFVSGAPFAYIPKRDFASEQAFLDFAYKLSDLQRKGRGEVAGSA